MRCAPSSAATAAVSLLRLLLASMLVVAAAQWSAAPATAAAGGTVPLFAAAEPASDVALPREAALQVERKVKKDASAPAPLDCATVGAATLPPSPSRWQRGDPTRAPPSSGLPFLRPETRAPPLGI